jgi:type III pantothenate kinase
MLLTIDVGNTHITLGVFKNDNLSVHWRIATDLKKTEDEYAMILRNLFSLSEWDKSRVKGAIVESVIPHLNWVLKKSIRKVFDLNTLILTTQTNIGLKNLYSNPQEVGMDRLANAVCGKRVYGAPIIIVDFGTAITLDLVNRDGNYVGGVIMPGLEMGADALFKRTSKLPRISLLCPPHIIGKSTVTSLQAGLYYGALGSVSYLIEKFWEEIGYKTNVVATGGGAGYLVRELSMIDSYDPYLTLRGLKHIWEMNRKNLPEEEKSHKKNAPEGRVY